MRRTKVWPLAAILVACFTPPEGLGPAAQAMRAAEHEGARKYLPEEYAAARAEMAEAERELVLQDQVSVLNRSYRKANRLFANAERTAVVLRQHTIVRRQAELAAEAEMQMLMVTVAVIETQNPETDDLDLWNAMRKLEGGMETARRQYRAGEYERALETIRAMQRLADEIPRTVDLDTGV